MSLSSIYLKEFAQFVPTCCGQDSLGIALERLNQHDGDRLVLVNSHQHPLGIIPLSKLLHHVIETVSVKTHSTQIKRLETPLANLTPSVVLPLIALPAEWTLEQLGKATSVMLEQTYALVDQDAQFIGALDRDRILPYLINPLVDSTSSLQSAALAQESVILSPIPNPSSVPNLAELEHLHQLHQQQIVTLTQQLLVQRAELEQRIKVQQEEIARLRQHVPLAPLRFRDFASLSNAAIRSSSPTPDAAQPLLNALLQLLERLPLPLMLQTSEGTVLAQNSVWQQQVGELADPARIWHEASSWLGKHPSESRLSMDTVQAGPQPPLCPNLTFQPSAIAPLPLPQDAFPADEGLCQLGTHPDSCVCVCPLKDGREQVVQFVKISLGTLLPDLQLDWVTSSLAYESVDVHRGEAGAIANVFQLATLTPDQGQISLQTHEQTSSLEDSTPAPPLLQSLWLVMAQDVTQQQHLARELTAKNADLVQLNRLKDEFLACISHELKTPLTAVLGLSSLFKDQTLGELNQRQVHYAQLIYQSSRHLMGVVNDILDLTRIETGQLELLYGSVDIPNLCDRAFEQAKQLRLADSKNFPVSEEEEIHRQFSLEIEPGLGTLVADELRLRQMLVHLLSNSLKFTEANHPIGLKVSRWGGWIAFTVWDTGIGIPAEKQHLIFQKFQQLENPLTRRFEGAGLGLVLTRRLARLHGGDVTFISKENAGSQFTVLLPPSPPDKTQLTRNPNLADEDDTQTPAVSYPSGRVPVYSYKAAKDIDLPIALPTNVRDRLVLIVDAVPRFVETLTEKLTGLGYRVVIARSGTEALEKARRLQPCVIFLNPLLPLLSGWDVLTLLKSGGETQHIPVVVTATVIDEDRAHQNQANGFLKLPVQTQKLQNLLHQLLLGTKTQVCQPPSVPQTILHLFCNQLENLNATRSLPLEELLRSHQYRILESDDLDQAELLAGVWQPNVVLLEGAIADPTSYLQRLSYHPILASLPIVMLDSKTAQIANQIAGLRVFPCLLSGEVATSGTPPDLSTLLQVIQIAAGCVWQPSVLAVDLSILKAQSSVANPHAIAKAQMETLGAFPQEMEWLQALMQYLQTAGIEGLIGQSWQEVVQQIQSQSVDLLLLCWTHGEPQSIVLERLSQLRDLSPKPPIIVLDHRDPDLGETTLIPLPEQVRELATQILSPPIAMSELLEQIQRSLQK